MAFIPIDDMPALTTPEGRRECLRMLFAARAGEGKTPRGDIEVLETEFDGYTDEGELTVRIPVRPWQVNGLDNVQGGILVYMIDCVFGAMSFVTNECGPVGTIDTTANYLRPVTLEDGWVTIRARAVTNSRRMIHATAELYNARGKVAVTASTNIMKKNSPAAEK